MAVGLALASAAVCLGAEGGGRTHSPASSPAKADPADRPADVMSPAQWKQIDRAADKALRWL
ncbi:hypothetical protein LCGC14_2286730, partial [marine sediment metagenome]